MDKQITRTFRSRGVTRLAVAASAALLMATLAVPASATAVSGGPEADPRPLTVTLDDYGLNSFAVTADRQELVLFGLDAPGAVYAADTLERIADFPGTPYGSSTQYTQTTAQGTTVALSHWDGYSVANLADRSVETYTVAPTAEVTTVELAVVAAQADGTVTGITFGGHWVTLEQGAVTAAVRVFADGTWPDPLVLSPDGSRALFVDSDPVDPERSRVVVVDMRTGSMLLDTSISDSEYLYNWQFDASNGSIWGISLDDGALVNRAVPGGEIVREVPGDDPGLDSLLRVESDTEWFVGSTWGELRGGSMNAPDTAGARTLLCCTQSVDRLGSNGDLVAYDMEMRQVSVVFAPRITHPENVAIEGLGTDVEFRSFADGVALTEEEAGNGHEARFGSTWQSSVDGVVWTDVPGAAAPSVGVRAAQDTYPLQYRRAFHDGFWGPVASDPAQMLGRAPVITRADDLPRGKEGAAYPAETITATGQPDLTWSVVDLPGDLSMDPKTGTITGTTARAGEYTFTVTVTDFFGSDTKPFTLVVEKAVVPKPDPKPDPDPDPKPDPKPGPDPKPDPGRGPGDSTPLAATGGVEATGLWVGAGALAALGAYLVARGRTRARANEQ